MISEKDELALFNFFHSNIGTSSLSSQPVPYGRINKENKYITELSIVNNQLLIESNRNVKHKIDIKDLWKDLSQQEQENLKEQKLLVISNSSTANEGHIYKVMSFKNGDLQLQSITTNNNISVLLPFLGQNTSEKEFEKEPEKEAEDTIDSGITNPHDRKVTILEEDSDQPKQLLFSCTPDGKNIDAFLLNEKSKIPINSSAVGAENIRKMYDFLVKHSPVAKDKELVIVINKQRKITAIYINSKFHNLKEQGKNVDYTADEAAIFEKTVDCALSLIPNKLNSFVPPTAPPAPGWDQIKNGANNHDPSFPTNPESTNKKNMKL